ncbi:MAG: metal ABC transporter permease [Alphaproteobacteria bacterium]|nr:metal ABC transporter permease [Alphaproteobacteria bacterium]
MHFFSDHYNIILVIITTIMLGLSCGMVGPFLVLRKEALISDAMTHSTLPGLGVGFLLALSMGLNGGRFLPFLLLCSGITALLGALSVRWIINRTRLSQDVAIASVMSSFYGLGLVILSIIQSLETGNRAGLNSFLLGQVSGLTQQDLFMLTGIATLVLLLGIYNFKALRLLCFDPINAEFLGISKTKTENILLFLMISVICAGLKTVGLILILALLIIPPITARLWTDRSEVMFALSCAIAALACVNGVVVSGFFYDLPTGAIIVLSCAGFLFASLILSPIRRIINAQ